MEQTGFMVPQCYASPVGLRAPRTSVTSSTILAMQRITSRHNAVVARYRAAARGDDESVMLLDGSHLVEEALDAKVPLRHVAIAGAAATTEWALLARLSALGVEPVSVSPPVMAALSPVHTPSTVVALADRPADRGETIFAGRAPLVVATVNVQDPGNLGAIVRTAEAGGASGLVTTAQSANPFGWKALRGSMGSALRLPIASIDSVESLVSAARRGGCRVIAAAPRGGRDPFDTPMNGATLLLIGGEGRGLPPDVEADADLRVTIPMASPVESLNAATCAALLIYEVRRQRLASSPDGLPLSSQS